MSIACPHCAEQFDEDPMLAGQIVTCPSCAGQFCMPTPRVSAGKRFAPSSPKPGHRKAPSGIAVPLLVSAISNIVVGLIWFATCFGAIFTIPMLILCVFEFHLYSRVRRDPVAAIARGASNLAIFEIIVGLVNPPTLICGIILLRNSRKYLDPTLRAAKRARKRKPAFPAEMPPPLFDEPGPPPIDESPRES